MNVYQNSFETKTINLKKGGFLILIFIMILTSILAFYNQFYDYYQGTGMIEEKNTLSMLVNVEDLKKIINHNEIIIEGTTFTYKVVQIKETNLEYGTDIYKKVFVNFESDEAWNIDHNYISYKIITGKDTIINYVLKTIKGEVK